ncbi:uncharacterized protein LOC132719419 [Ruditapes philippinarum]|uniref:uncharacterized protein LOC132719419 n=1 Tax=Ruditapes philippinarum TaxID=129788 RepID=UPI00295BA570|nr:uncharacterized protein LOC132719419 [Ruditapes philippinarum]
MADMTQTQESSKRKSEEEEKTIVRTKKHKSDETNAEESTDEIITEESTNDIITEESKDEIIIENITDEIIIEISKDEIITEESKGETITGESTVEIITEESKDEITTGETKDEITTEESNDEIITENRSNSSQPLFSARHSHSPLPGTSAQAEVKLEIKCKICSTAEGGEWIACDNCSQWLHRTCAGLKHHMKWKKFTKTSAKFYCKLCVKEFILAYKNKQNL